MKEITLEGEQASYSFNPYDKSNFLGSGGMGKVFVGKVISIRNSGLSPEDLAVGDKVAIKVIHRELMNNDTVVKRAYSESLIRIRNENLILMLDFVNYNNTFHIISKFIEGKTLSKTLNERNKEGFSVEEAIKMILQVLNGLSALHQNNIIHRDIKPSNISLDEDLNAVIMDLGVAKISDGRRLSVTGVGSILGTPHYSSPEQILGETDKIKFASDIYSTGITLYEAITGNSPFQSDSEWEVIKMQVKEPLPSIYNINDELQEIIQKATMKDAKKRYQKVEYIIEDLNYILEPPKGFPAKIKRYFNRLRRK